MDTQSEILKSNDQSWGYHDDLLFALSSPSPIRHIELSTLRYLNETPDNIEVSITDMLIYHAHHAVTLKREIEQLTPFRETAALEEILLLENGNKTLRIKLARFLSSHSPTIANFKLPFDAADSIYELLTSCYQCNVYNLSKKMSFPIFSAQDRTWKLALKSAQTRPSRTYYSQKRNDTFFPSNLANPTKQANTIEVKDIPSISPAQIEATAPSIIHPNRLKLSQHGYFQSANSNLYSHYFSLKPTKNLNDSFYESLATAIQSPTSWTHETIKNRLVTYLRQNASTYLYKIKLELNTPLLDIEAWLEEILTPNPRRIPSSEIYALAQILKRHIVIVSETGEMQYHLAEHKKNEPIFILLESNGLSYHALEVQTHAETHIRSAISQREAIKEVGTPACCPS